MQTAQHNLNVARKNDEQGTTIISTNNLKKLSAINDGLPNVNIENVETFQTDNKQSLAKAYKMQAGILSVKNMPLDTLDKTSTLQRLKDEQIRLKEQIDQTHDLYNEAADNEKDNIGKKLMNLNKQLGRVDVAVHNHKETRKNTRKDIFTGRLIAKVKEIREIRSLQAGKKPRADAPPQVTTSQTTATTSCGGVGNGRRLNSAPACKLSRKSKTDRKNTDNIDTKQMWEEPRVLHTNEVSAAESIDLKINFL